MVLPAKIKRSPEDEVRAWAEGRRTLKDIKGYSDEELYEISQLGYLLFLNGRLREAQTMFEGLVAVDPRNEYYYRALGVVYHRQGDAERAIRQFTHAITVAPRSVQAYVNRAEVHIARRDFARALADLKDASQLGPSQHPVVRKAQALRALLLKNPHREHTLIPGQS